MQNATTWPETEIAAAWPEQKQFLPGKRQVQLFTWSETLGRNSFYLARGRYRYLPGKRHKAETVSTGQEAGTASSWSESETTSTWPEKEGRNSKRTASTWLEVNEQFLLAKRQKQLVGPEKKETRK